MNNDCEAYTGNSAGRRGDDGSEREALQGTADSSSKYSETRREATPARDSGDLREVSRVTGCSILIALNESHVI